MDDNVWFLLLGATVAATFGLIRDLLVDNRRDKSSRGAEDRRWAREDAIREEGMKLTLDEDRRRIAREDALRERLERAAKRLVADELDTVGNHVRMMLKANAWPKADVIDAARFLPSDRWDEHKATLASAMDSQADFGNLAGFMYSVEQLRARARFSTSGEELETDVRSQLSATEQQAGALYWVVLGRHKLLVDDKGVRAVPIEDDAAADEGVHAATPPI